MTLDAYQLEAVAFLRSRKRAAVVSPAGSGKTVIAAAALDAVVNGVPRAAKVKVGWLCNTVEQAGQARLALAQFPDLTAKAVFRIRCAAAASDWSGCDVLVVDEAHHAGSADGWKAQVESCHGARWGFTATPPEDAEKRAVFESLFGSAVHVVPRESAAGRLAKAKVVMLAASDPGLREPITQAIDSKVEFQRTRMGYFIAQQEYGAVQRRVLGSALPARLPQADKVKEFLDGCIRVAGLKDRFNALLKQTVAGIIYRRVAWGVCVEMGIVNNSARNNAAEIEAARHVKGGASVLVLVNQVEHTKRMAAHIFGAEACWSGMGAKKRRDALARFKAGDLRCVVATSLADEGLDVPRANVLVLVSGGRSNAKTEQRTGRVLRAFAGKEQGLIYDFNDEAVHPLMGKHSRARVALYQKLGYDVTYV